MPSPKSGNAGSAVSPATPRSAKDADDAVAGSVDHSQGGGASNQGTPQDSAQVKPYKPPQTKEEREKKRSWIEIKLVDEDNNPVSGKEYSITLPDGSVASGTLDDKGVARVDGIDSGTCQITFPTLDKDAWEKL